LSLFVLLAPSWALAQTGLQPIPALSARVIDTTATLEAAQRQALENKLQAFEASKGSQIVVLIVPTTAPEDIVDYTQRVGDLWKIGRKDVGDGLLLVVAKDDRVVRIATAKTLEGAIPDLAARQVIDRVITPRFREGDFAGGLNAGVDMITALISGERLPEPSAADGPRSRSAGFQWLDLTVLFFIAVPFAARLLGSAVGRKLGSLMTGTAVGVLAWLLTASLVVGVLAGMAGMVFALASVLASGSRGAGWGAGMGGIGGLGGLGSGRASRGHGGFGSSGGFGGGFGSGGGGNFGGGGASGKW
jgi:uncharacterized protein